MLSKDQLRAEVRLLRNRLQEFEKQLNQCGEVTIETASVGDTLPDGSIVLQKSNGLALLVAPSSTEVEATWSKEFTEVFQKLKEKGFNSSQWFVPTKEQLQLAYKTIRDEFSATFYWSSTEFNSSSTEFNATIAFFVSFYIGGASINNKSGTLCVRAFRCVTY